jgi:peptidyl-prolyl cis-trans isomerase D
MLKLMRTGAQSQVIKVFFFGILLLGTVGLALFGVQDVFRHGMRSQSVATIGREKISKTDLDNMVTETIRSKRMSREDAYRQGVPMIALQREVNSRIFIKAANDLGLIIDDATVRRELDNLLKPMMDKGLTEKQALENILYNFNTSEGRLVASLKAEIAVEKLSHALADGASAPREMVDDFMQYRYEWRRGDYIKLTTADAEVKAPTDKDLQELYASELKTHYMQPENRSFSVLVLDATAVGGKKPETAVDAKSYYDAHKAEFAITEKRVVSEVSTEDDTTAQAVYSRAKISKDLKSAASTAGKNKAIFTSDTYSKESFLPEELADDVFKAPAGTLLPPKKGLMGRMIIAHVDKIIPAGTMSFEEAKPRIEKELAAQSSGGSNSEALYNRAGEIDEMIGGGKSLAEVAKQFNLKITDFNKVDAQGNDANGKKADAQGVPDFEKVVKTAWTLDKGAASQPVQTATGEFIVVELHDITPAQAKPFASVRDDVVQAWKQKQAGAALDAKASKLMERLHMGDTFENVAASVNKTIQHTALIQREDEPGKDKADQVEPGVKLALFNIDKVGQATSVPGPGSITIVRLADRKIDNSKPPSQEDVQSMQSMLSQGLQTDILEQYRKSLMAKYDVTIDEEALKSMYAPQEAAEEDQQQAPQDPTQ